jgi:HEAT repeat protein
LTLRLIKILVTLSLCCISSFCAHNTKVEEFLQFSEAFEKIGDYEGAIKSLKIAKFLHKDHVLCKKALARMYNKSGRLDKSLPLTVELMQGSAQDYKKHFHLLEDLCWAVLKNKALCEDPTYSAALQAALVTNDVRSIAMLCKALDSPSIFVRYVALKLAARTPDLIVQKCLIKRLQLEKVALLRKDLCDVLSRSRLDEVKDALENTLAVSSLSSQERGYACLALCNLYPIIDSQALASLMNHKNPDFRALSIHVLKKKKVKKRQAYLRTFLNDPILSVRQAASSALLEFSDSLDDSLLAPLKKLSLTDHPSVAINVALVLAKKERSQSQRRLNDLLKHPESEIRNVAAYFLGKLLVDDNEACAKVLKYEGDPFVRANFAISLFEYGCRSDAVIAQIENVLLDSSLIQNRAVSYCSAHIICKSNVNYVPHIQDYPKLEDISARLHLLSMLCVTNSQKAMPLMKRFLKEKMWGVSASFAMLLIQEGGAEQIELVQKLVNDEDPSVSLQASLVLAFLKHNADVLERLIQRYDDCSYPIKLTILEALGRLGDKRAIPFLLSRLQDPFQTTNIVAASSIIQCLYH